VTPQEFIYLTEMLMKPQERVFAHLLRTDPGDKLTRDAFADWLTDEGRPDAAQLVRGGFTPGGSWYREPLTVTAGPGPTMSIVSGVVCSGAIGVGSWPTAPYLYGASGSIIVGPPSPPSVEPLTYSGHF
jgi:uncharacterized protein (TIGR02996 family)